MLVKLVKEKESIHFRQEKELLKIKMKEESCFQLTIVSLIKNLEIFTTIDCNHDGKRLTEFPAFNVSFSRSH